MRLPTSAQLIPEITLGKGIALQLPLTVPVFDHFWLEAKTLEEASPKTVRLLEPGATPPTQLAPAL